MDKDVVVGKGSMFVGKNPVDDEAPVGGKPAGKTLVETLPVYWMFEGGILVDGKIVVGALLVDALPEDETLGGTISVVAIPVDVIILEGETPVGAVILEDTMPVNAIFVGKIPAGAILHGGALVW